MTEAEQLAHRFVAAWERGDIDEVLDCFAEDAIFRPGPMKPALGKPAIREMLTEWFDMMIVVSVEIHNTVSDGRTVVHERTHRSKVGNQERATPTAVVFEVDNGLITACREYFDMPSFTSP